MGTPSVPWTAPFVTKSVKNALYHFSLKNNWDKYKMNLKLAAMEVSILPSLKALVRSLL